jgi:hypothetical protein
MATFTASLSGSTVVNGSKNYTISDADIQRLIDYLIVRYTPKGPDAVPPSKQVALGMWIQEFVDSSTNRELEHSTTQNIPPPIVFA